MPHREGLLNEELINACEKRRSDGSNEKMHFGRKAQTPSTVVDGSALDEEQSDDVAAEENGNDGEEKKSGKGSQQKRDRKFSLSSYIRPERLEILLRRSDWIQHWAYCTHDRDVLADGSIKEAHTHVILYTYNAKTSSAIRKIFERYSVEICEEGEEPQNTLCQICGDMVSAYRYLIHADQKNKAQYEPLERICDNFAYWQKLEESCGYNDVLENKGKKMLDDMLSGVSTYEMVQRYGKEYIYHSQQFKLVVEDIYKECRATPSVERFRDFCSFVLDCSPFKSEDINTFFTLLTYCQSMIDGENANLSHYVKG